MDVSALPPFTMVECPQCGVQTRVKSRFGPFRLTRRHAVGGMSMVFAAQDETLDREVALKILNEDYSADERRIAAFEQEARLTASFSHPHVVRVFTTGRAYGRFYIAMEMVPGGHLEQRIHDFGKIPEAGMLPLAIEVARGLKAAKAAGLIHRDVKPGNILLDADGHAKLVDFGLALVTQGGKARAAELWATPYYVPPETVEGAEEDFRSDIYAFGATLYHTLSGKPPCGEESISTDALREAKKHVPPLEKTDPSISAGTCRLVNKAMAYHAADRHASYDELIADLSNALARLKNGGAPATTASGRLRARTRRERLRLPAAAAAIAVIAAVVGFSWHLSQRVPQEPEVVQAPVIAPPPVPVQEVDHSAEITRGFREARAALEAADYEKAGRAFMALHGNPHVHEPTRTWAALEAVLAAFLDGRSADARKAAAAALEHVRTLPPDHPLAGAAWIELLEGVGELKPLASSATDQSASAMVAAMLAGLKNWEQGMPDAAVECFRKVVDAKLAEEEDWAVFYQKMAGNYLADHQILESGLFAGEPADAAECGKRIAQLDEALAMLKTRGRARYNLRAWQLDLKRRSHLLAAGSSGTAGGPPPGQVPALDEVLAHLSVLADNWRFAEAAEYLKGLPGDPSGATRDSLVAVAEAAMVFLADLGDDLAREPFAGDLPMRDGRTVSGLAAADDGSLRATKNGGETIACQWSDFTADALIALHRVLVKRPASEIERLRRHECAIAFDWLAGDRQRALAAASNLAQSSPTFKKRWDAIAGGLPKT
jgi:tRNA A-37 threonylcarbamoyl transferase component Bud32